MLNELAEFNDYTIEELDNPALLENSRIKYDTFLKKPIGKVGKERGDLNGIKRFMTTIARLFYFEHGGEEGIKYARTALKLWLGDLNNDFTDKKILDNILDEFPYLKNWLPNYISRLAELYKWKDNNISQICYDALNDLKVFVGHLNYSVWDYRMSTTQRQKMESANDSFIKNTYKVITYERIIANAISEGELQCYYLAGCGKWQTCVKTSKTDRNHIVRDSLKPLRKNSDDKVLKLISYYLLAEKQLSIKQPNKTHFVQLNLIDLQNWFNAGKVTKTIIKSFYYVKNDRIIPLFDYQSLNGNIVKFRLNNEFRNDYDWQIIEATENDDNLDEFIYEHCDEEYFFYADNGGHEKLIINERYIG